MTNRPALDQCEHISTSVDFLTFTCDSASDEHLLSVSEPDEQGHATRGFGASERRTFAGGTCWRKWAPHQPHKVYGFKYATWEWDGGASDSAACLVRDLTGRPSRVDVAFDFRCPSDYASDDFADAISPHLRAKRIKDGISGEDGINTRYVGSSKSDRRIRIYRKDCQSQGWLLMHGPTLRVELMLFDDYAHAWWQVWAGNWADREAKGYAGAAAHVLAMTGLRIVDDVGEVPKLQPLPDTEAEQTLLAFIEQYGGYVATAAAHGVPLVDLCGIAASKQGRMGQHRQKKLGKKIAAAGPGLVERLREALSPVRRRQGPEPVPF